jgi:hypothetical protein
VRVSILDDHLKVNALVDRIVHDSGDAPSSYFRADSYMELFYQPEPGEYNPGNK